MTNMEDPGSNEWKLPNEDPVIGLLAFSLEQEQRRHRASMAGPVYLEKRIRELQGDLDIAVWLTPKERQEKNDLMDFYVHQRQQFQQQEMWNRETSYDHGLAYAARQMLKQKLEELNKKYGRTSVDISGRVNQELAALAENEDELRAIGTVVLNKLETEYDVQNIHPDSVDDLLEIFREVYERFMLTTEY